MGLRFIDSFAHYAIGFGYRKWTLAPGGTIQTGGRRGAPYLTPTTGFFKTLGPSNNFTIGGAFNYASTNTTFLQAVLNGGELLGVVAINGDQTLSVVAVGGGPNSNILTSTQAITANVWNYIETSFLLSGGTSTLTLTASLIVNGDLWGAGTGTINGITGANLLFPGAVANQVGIYLGPAGRLAGVQDLYVLDTSTTDINGFTTTNTTFLGDVEVDALFPAADVAVTWGTVGGDGTNAYTCINETSPDDDTSYIFTSNTGTIESFTYQPISGFTGTIYGAQYLACMKKDAEGFRTAGLTLAGTKVASSNFATTTGSNTSTDQYLSDYYVYYIAPLDSALGTAWTTAVFNTSTFGVVVTT